MLLQDTNFAGLEHYSGNFWNLTATLRQLNNLIHQIAANKEVNVMTDSSDVVSRNGSLFPGLDAAMIGPNAELDGFPSV